MKYVVAAVSVVALVSSLSGFSTAQVVDRSFVNEVPDEVSEHQNVCAERIAAEWSKPEIGDENYTRLKLNMALNRVDNGRESVVFYGSVFNRFLQLEQEATVTCRISDQPPYLVSFRVAR